jgi:hypothetical protein
MRIYQNTANQRIRNHTIPKANAQQSELTDTKTLKVSKKVYDWLTSESKSYHDFMDIILSRFINEVEESKKKSKK